MPSFFRRFQRVFKRKKPTPSKTEPPPVQSEVPTVVKETATVVNKIATGANDITAPIATTAPGSQFSRVPHPVQPVGLSGIDLQNPIPTNKYWGTLPIPGTNPTAQQGNVFSFPYTLWWSNANPSGLNIQHVEASQIVFDTATTPPQYYLNPLGIISWNLGASEFDQNMGMTLDTPTQFTINVNLSPQSGVGSIKIPIVEGMAFITGIYNNLTPFLQTVGKAILSFQSSTLASGTKYKVSLNDGTTWLIYGFPSSGSFSLSQSGANLVGSGKFTGYIQVAKIPTGDTTSETLYDANAGTYVIGMQLFGSTSGSTGTYGFNFTVAGTSTSVLHFALPHHQASFDATTQSGATGLYLKSTTMGQMRAYTGSQWTMTENLPTDITFLSGGTGTTPISASALSAIQTAAESDIGYTVASSTANAGSQYFAGKWMAKYAEIVLVANDVLKNPTLTATGVANLTAAFATFANNKQNPPLCYDTTWKGLISTAGIATASSPAGNSGVDFGNTWYNDHHFHYGYFVYAAALLGHIDPSWLTPSNIDYVNSLVRDVANPSSQDPYFPVFRMFDWFVGHSWAEGLFFSGDGKNEESSSEDYNFSYGMKLWGLVTNNASMQACGDLMLAVQRRYHLQTFPLTVDL
jgi:endo-1,3(4)-beta-glucanase